MILTNQNMPKIAEGLSIAPKCGRCGLELEDDGVTAKIGGYTCGMGQHYIATGNLSACCHAPLAHDATRAYCTKCDRVDCDLNDWGVAEGHFYRCPECSGTIGDDLDHCETCDGDGMVEA